MTSTRQSKKGTRRRANARRTPPPSWERLVASIASKQADGGLIESPFASSGTNVATEISKTSADALLFLDSDRTLAPEVLVAAALASGNDFILGDEDTEATRALYKACGLNVFLLRGANARVFGSNFEFECKEATILHELDKDEGGRVFPGYDNLPQTTNEDDSPEVVGTLEVVACEDITKAEHGEDTTEERIVFGIVYEPGELDAHGHFMTDATLRTMAHSFMEKRQTIGLQHTHDISAKTNLLESYITPFSGNLNGRDIKKGTWMMMIRVLDDTIWKAVKSGALTGFSFGGSGVLVPRDAPS